MKTSIPKLSKIRWKDGIFADNVEVLGDTASVDVDPLHVLKGAFHHDLTEVAIIGYNPDGVEVIMTSSTCQQRAHYLFSRAALQMLRVSDTLEE